MTRKITVLLFSLGAPEKLSSVRPFLSNLFNDPAIIDLPTPLRQILAYVISKKRTPEASEIYKEMGGGSPLLPNTQKQADALLACLQKLSPHDSIECLPVMRYWHPRASEIAQKLAVSKPDLIVFLPMYPQFSTTTNRSSMLEMHKELDKCNVYAKRKIICCFPDETGFIKAAVEAIRPMIKEAHKKGFDNPRLLLSAHGIPKNIISKRGDPYQKHCILSAQKIIQELGDEIKDYLQCYQSRVGPLEWLKPYTEDAIRQAGKEKKAIIVFPLAFVSEHSETLVELDIEYKELAEKNDVPLYLRAPAVAENKLFINGLTKIVLEAINQEDNLPTCSLKASNQNCPGENCCPLDKLSKKYLIQS